MTEIKSKVKNLAFDLKEYGTTRKDLAVLKASDKAAGMVSNITAYTVFLFISLFFLLFFSITLAFLISDLFDSTFAGFLSVTLLYLVLGIVFWGMKNKWIKEPVSTIIIKKIFENADN